MTAALPTGVPPSSLKMWRLWCAILRATFVVLPMVKYRSSFFNFLSMLVPPYRLYHWRAGWSAARELFPTASGTSFGSGVLLAETLSCTSFICNDAVRYVILSYKLHETIPTVVNSVQSCHFDAPGLCYCLCM